MITILLLLLLLVIISLQIAFYVFFVWFRSLEFQPKVFFQLFFLLHFLGRTRGLFFLFVIMKVFFKIVIFVRSRKVGVFGSSSQLRNEQQPQMAFLEVFSLDAKTAQAELEGNFAGDLKILKAAFLGMRRIDHLLLVGQKLLIL